jgi:Cell division protein CrgA
VPKSRTRSKAVYTPPARAAKAKVSPLWLAPTMVGTLLIGLIWIIVFYVSSESYPVGAIGAWNLVVGFIFIVGGLGLATRWR